MSDAKESKPRFTTEELDEFHRELVRLGYVQDDSDPGFASLVKLRESGALVMTHSGFLRLFGEDKIR